jgi:hypothetical protein
VSPGLALLRRGKIDSVCDLTHRYAEKYDAFNVSDSYLVHEGHNLLI